MDDKQRAFHLEEFGELRAELLEALAKGESLFVYAVLAAAAIVTWLITELGTDGTDLCALVVVLSPFHAMPWWLPFVTTLCVGGLGFARYRRVKEIGAYLRRLEGALGHPDLGWEKYLASRRWRLVVKAYVASWLVLLVGAIYFAVAMTIETASCVAGA